MTKRRVNKYPKAFRQMAVERMRNCDNVSALAKELGIDRTVLYHWRNLAPGGGRGNGQFPCTRASERDSGTEAGAG